MVVNVDEQRHVLNEGHKVELDLYPVDGVNKLVFDADTVGVFEGASHKKFISIVLANLKHFVYSNLCLCVSVDKL